MKEKFSGAILSGYFFEATLAFFSLMIGYIGSTVAVHLPGGAPAGISNLYLSNGYNPEENYLRIILLVVFGLAAYLGLKKLSANDRVFRLTVIVLLVFGLFAGFLLPKVESFKSNIDTFHHGEQLSPALDFGKGKGLYTDIFMQHGAGEDVVLPHLALHLPGTNPNGGIGSFFFVITTLEVVSAFLFFFLISKLSKSTLVFLVTSLWFLLSYYSVFYYVRDIFVWGTILLIASLLLHKHKAKTTRNLLLLIGFLSSATYFYSIDRAFVATLAAVLTAGALVLFQPVANGLRFDWRISLKRFLPAVYVASGALLAQIFGLVLLGGTQYIEFLKLSFITIPKYEGYLFGQPLKPLGLSTYVVWLPLFIAALGAIMLFVLAKHQYTKYKALNPSVLLGAIIYIAALLFLRVGYGRPDLDHVAYSTPLLFLSAFYLSAVAYQEFRETNLQLLWPVVLLVVLLFYPVQTISSERALALANTNANSISKYLQLPGTTDRSWLPGDVIQTSDYIRQNTKADDPIFVFTQQPIYYYTSGRQNSSKFYIPWFADPPALTSQLLNDLKTRPPKIIVYFVGNPWDKSDGYLMSDRAPEVDSWIKLNYTKQVNVGSAVLLEK